jgi:hypothetical protein
MRLRTDHAGREGRRPEPGSGREERKTVATFSVDDQKRLAEACQRAEEITGDHFHLSGFGPRRYLYEVATAEDLRPGEAAEGAFAQICRYDAVSREPGHRARAGRYYRVCLQDEGILAAVRRPRCGFGLDALLLYVMTHELIHVVRFEQFRHPFVTEPARRAEEEAVVHGITYAVLATAEDRSMQRLLSYYRSHRMPHLL